MFLNYTISALKYVEEEFSDRLCAPKSQKEESFAGKKKLLPTLAALVHLQVFLIFLRTATATAKSLQSCPTLCNPIDGSPPGSPVPGILQARTLEWVAISFSTA